MRSWWMVALAAVVGVAVAPVTLAFAWIVVDEFVVGPWRLILEMLREWRDRTGGPRG